MKCDKILGWTIDISLDADIVPNQLLPYEFIRGDYQEDFERIRIDCPMTLLISQNKYVKLVCIKDIVGDYEDLFVGDNQDNEILNKFLKQIPVSDEIYVRMKGVYQELLSTNDEPEVHLQQIHHWYRGL